jgi:dihydropteroate synthase
MNERVDNCPKGPSGPIACRGKKIDLSDGPVVMGVLNVTPDSFYDGGRYGAYEQAVERAWRMVDEGAAILDVGGESSRPGSDPVPAEVQKERILPVIQAVRERWQGWISVDTCSSDVARAAVEQGADMINDISAGGLDPDMKKVAAELGVPCILMHMKGKPKTMQDEPVYGDVVPEIIEHLAERIAVWEDAGVASENILVDPGIGFGKTVDHNLLILKHLRELEVLGRPIVLGTSRKAFVGALLDRDLEGRLVGTLATVAIGAWNGAHILRVHDVQETREVLTIVHAIKEARGHA